MVNINSPFIWYLNYWYFVIIPPSRRSDLLATGDVSKVAEASTILTVLGAGFPKYTKLEMGREGGRNSYSTQVSLTFKGMFQISA